VCRNGDEKFKDDDKYFIFQVMHSTGRVYQFPSLTPFLHQ